MTYFIKGHLIIILMFSCLSIVGQQLDRVDSIEQQLNVLADSLAPGLNEKVAASVSSVNITEFVRGLAISNGLNISVDPDLDIKITVNFANETVLNILVFLTKQYNLDIQLTGSIIYVTSYRAPPKPIISVDPNISFNATNATLWVDIRNDTLSKVVKKIVQVSGTNIITTPEVSSQRVSLFVQDLPLETAIEKLALANDLIWSKEKDGTYLIGSLEPSSSSYKPGQKKTSNGQVPRLNHDLQLDVRRDASGVYRVTLNAIDVSIADLIKIVSQELGVDYFLFNEPDGKTTINIEALSYHEFLAYVLRGTSCTYNKEGGIYLIGKRIQEGFMNSQVIPLKYRTTDVVIENIPVDLTKDLEIKAFPELNSLIVSGPEVSIARFEHFIYQIDKVVPVVMIEVLILDVSNSRNLSTGIEAGISSEPVETGGKVFPGVDVTIGSGSLNNILDIISGSGVINLGKVAPEFYVKLSALETQGLLKIRSTPRLSTLNGHEAEMTIGRTEYYVEQTNNIIGTQNPQTVVTQVYKPIKADFSVVINPTVSADGQVTLTIDVEQSDFTSRITNNAPPGTTTRSFRSLIRVKSDEMIILGGLEETRISDSGSGVPFLSRIPIIKWLFSSRTKQKSKTKLSILIKPTVIY